MELVTRGIRSSGRSRRSTATTSPVLNSPAACRRNFLIPATKRFSTSPTSNFKVWCRSHRRLGGGFRKNRVQPKRIHDPQFRGQNSSGQLWTWDKFDVSRLKAQSASRRKTPSSQSASTTIIPAAITATIQRPLRVVNFLMAFFLPLPGE